MPGIPAVTGITYVQIVLRPESAAACMDGYATLGYQRKGTFTSCCLTTTMTRGTARILISQPRTRPCTCGAQDHLLEYGEGVFDIGLAVLDAGVSWDFAVTAGAESLLHPRYSPLRDLTSMTSAAAIRVPGTGIRHSLLSHPEQAAVAVTEQEWIGYVRISVAAGTGQVASDCYAALGFRYLPVVSPGRRVLSAGPVTVTVAEPRPHSRHGPAAGAHHFVTMVPSCPGAASVAENAPAPSAALCPALDGPPGARTCALTTRPLPAVCSGLARHQP